MNENRERPSPYTNRRPFGSEDQTNPRERQYVIDIDDDTQFEFLELAIRHEFIRKVYSILLLQIALTIGIILWFMFHEPSRMFILHYDYQFWGICFACSLVFLIALVCCGDLRRRSPANVILLGLFTVVEGLILAWLACHYSSDIVLMAAGITSVVCSALTLFACQTKWDFTGFGVYLFIFVIILFVFGIVSIFVYNQILHLVYSSFGVLLFSVYLIYDTQLILGGKHKYSVSPEEYIMAALNLYLDIVLIFMYILGLLRN